MRALFNLEQHCSILKSVLAGLILYSLCTPSQAETEAEQQTEQQTINTAAQHSPLSMAIFPRRNAKISVKLFTPLADYLSRELGRSVKLIVSKDFKSFWSGVTHQSYDIVHYNQYHYVVSHKKYNYQVIARNVEFGEATIAGAIIVHSDAGINSIADLKGKKIVFGGGPFAMQSYIVARYLLEQAGLNKGDYTEEFARSPTNAIFAVYFRQSAAAGTGDKNLRLDIVRKRIDITKLKYLARGEQLPHLPWAVNGKLSTALRTQIQILLTTLNESPAGKAVLESAELDGLQITDDKGYDPHRKIIREVYNEQY